MTRSRALRPRRAFLLVVVAAFVAVAVTVFLRWPSLRAWYVLRTRFEPIGATEGGLSCYRHLASGLEMVLLSGGEFLRGSPPGEVGSFPDEKPRHLVRLSRFLIARREVSQADWRAVLGPRFFLVAGGRLPAHGVSWIECRAYCDAAGLALPTEAEWEYACRAGSETAYAFGDELTTADANFGGGTAPWPVDRGRENEYGLFNVHGNVGEWCVDSYRSDEYARAPAARAWVSPACREEIDSKVVRGGSWDSTREECRSARRNALPFSAASLTAGFRPVFRFEGD